MRKRSWLTTTLETTMHPSAFLPGCDTLLLMIPFLAVLALAALGLDEKLATPKQGPGARRSYCGVDQEGRPVLSDPDGRPWRHGRVSHIAAKLGKAIESNRPLSTPGRMVLRAKIGPDRGPHGQVFVRGVGDEAVPEGCGGPTVEDENDVWPDFHPDDKDPSLGSPICAATRRDGTCFPDFVVVSR